MADPSYQTLHQSQVALDPKYQAFHQSKVAGPKLSGCLPVRSSWTQAIRLFTSQTWRTQVNRLVTSGSGPKISGFSPVKSGRTQVIRLLTSYKWLTQVIRTLTSQKWQDPSYQAAYQLEVAGPKLSGFSPVKSGRTQVIRLPTS